MSLECLVHQNGGWYRFPVIKWAGSRYTIRSNEEKSVMGNDVFEADIYNGTSSEGISG